ncbi:MAG: hypothetical protein WAV38_39210, partial [Xanthobacteraceae bacterium]
RGEDVWSQRNSFTVKSRRRFPSAHSQDAHSRCPFWNLRLLGISWWFGQFVEVRADQVPSWTRLRFEMEESLHMGG